MRAETRMFFFLIGCAFLSFSADAQEIDTTKLRPGLLLDFFPITDTSKPDKPVGRSLATLVYKDGFPADYRDPFELEPTLDKYRDRYWLVEYFGFIEIKNSGDHTFVQTIYSSGNKSKCGGDLYIEDEKIISQNNEGFSKSKNLFSDLSLKKGLYRIKTTLFCTYLYNNDIRIELEIGMRGPRDPIVKPVSPDILFYLGE